MTARALLAMIQARLYVSRRLVFYAFAVAALVAVFVPAGVTAPLFCCALLAVAIALDQTPGRHPHLDRCEQSAPLFGRELARAKALVPCIAGLIATVAYAGVAIARGSADAATTLLVVSPAVVACALVALSATVRRGWTRALYVVLACATSAGAYALAVAQRIVLAEVAFCAIVAFLALRQYGETLARWDPV